LGKKKIPALMVILVVRISSVQTIENRQNDQIIKVLLGITPSDFCNFSLDNVSDLTRVFGSIMLSLLLQNRFTGRWSFSQLVYFIL